MDATLPLLPSAPMAPVRRRARLETALEATRGTSQAAGLGLMVWGTASLPPEGRAPMALLTAATGGYFASSVAAGLTPPASRRYTVARVGETAAMGMLAAGLTWLATDAGPETPPIAVFAAATYLETLLLAQEMRHMRHPEHAAPNTLQAIRLGSFLVSCGATVWDTWICLDGEVDTTALIQIVAWAALGCVDMVTVACLAALNFPRRSRERVVPSIYGTVDACADEALSIMEESYHADDEWSVLDEPTSSSDDAGPSRVVTEPAESVAECETDVVSVGDSQSDSDDYVSFESLTSA